MIHDLRLSVSRLSKRKSGEFEKQPIIEPKTPPATPVYPNNHFPLS